MHCRACESTRIKKNGFRRGKPSYRCRDCGYQFVESPTSKGYSTEVKQRCLEMYVNGMGFRAIARVTGLHHVTVINWVKQAAENLSDEPNDDEIPEITEIDELQTFVGNKRNKVWIWTVVNHWKPGIILWTLGDRSSQTFEKLWVIIRCWHSFWYVTDGYPVYPSYIAPEDHLISKTYMTRVEGENTRLRHYLARLKRKTLCYSKSAIVLKYSIRLLLHYLRFGTVPVLP